MIEGGRLVGIERGKGTLVRYSFLLFALYPQETLVTDSIFKGLFFQCAHRLCDHYTQVFYAHHSGLNVMR